MQSIFLKQADLELALKQIFPEKRIISNSRKQSNVINPQNNRNFELDVWFPEIKLAFEFQDPYHYITSGLFRELPVLQQRDQSKKLLAEQKGITFILIPCWWDGKIQSLISTIKFYRKDLLLDYKASGGELPIPTTPPTGYFDDMQVMAVPEIGDLLSSSSVPPAIVPSTWWISEKYDGYRAFWHYKHHIMYTRWGRRLSIPDSILSTFPKLHLDGEIWAGRGLFEMTMKTLNPNEQADWTSVRFIVFDSLEYSEDSSLYEHRMTRCCEAVGGHPFAVPISSMLCKNKQHMRNAMLAVLLAKGEGITLRRVKSQYEKGRSSTLVKLKAIRDQEALCVDVLPDGYLLKLPNDVTFVATFKAKETRAPKPGDVVTFMFRYYSHEGRPSSAEILRPRDDLEWRDVLANNLHSPTIDKINAWATEDRKTYTRWGLDDVSKVRELMDKVAFELGRDPLVPSSWYDVSMRQIISVPGGLHAIRLYGSSVTNLVLAAYPDIGLDVTRFARLQKSYWDDPRNMRMYLDQIAAKRGFDPLIADNWHKFASSEMFNEAAKGYFFQRGYKKILCNVYGKYGVKESMFNTLPMNYYDDIENRRDFFVKVAKAQGLDPLNMEDWYSLSSSIVQSRGGQYVLIRYNRSIFAAMQDIFPNHKWEEYRFEGKSMKYWTSERMRQCFDDFATHHNFDPLVAENWYNVKRLEYMGYKDLKRIVTLLFQNSFLNALKHIYPTVRFNDAMFQRAPANYWQTPANARKFFDALATKRGFDPLQAQNWYKLPRHIVQAEKGGRAILLLYGGAMPKVLSTLYPEVTFDVQKYSNYFTKVL